MLSAQNTHTINGIVSEKTSQETLIGANITIKELRTGVITNEYGFYSLTLPEGVYTIKISFLGYKSQQLNISLNSDTTLNFEV